MMKDSARQNAFTAQQFIRALAYVEARKEVLHLMRTPESEAAERELHRLTIFIEQDTTDQMRLAIHQKNHVASANAAKLEDMISEVRL